MSKKSEKPGENEPIIEPVAPDDINTPEGEETSEPIPKPAPKAKSAKAGGVAFNPMATVPDPDEGRETKQKLDSIESQLGNLEKKIENFFSAKPEPKPKAAEPKPEPKKSKLFDEFEFFPEV